MNPGELRQRVTIMDPDSTKKNEAGEVIPGYKEVATVWAKVIPIRGREYLEAKKIKPELQYRVTIRYRNDIHPAMALIWGKKELKIEAAIDIAGRHAFLELACTEEVETI